MTDLAVAFAIAMFLEGVAWALFPGAMKRAMVHVLAQPLSSVRTVGLLVALVAVAAVWLLRG